MNDVLGTFSRGSFPHPVRFAWRHPVCYLLLSAQQPSSEVEFDRVQPWNWNPHRNRFQQAILDPEPLGPKNNDQADVRCCIVPIASPQMQPLPITKNVTLPFVLNPLAINQI